jgi:hypothetical protein
MDRLERLGLIEVAVPARRGRVASYRLRHGAIDALTEPVWAAAGPAMAARMGEGQGGSSPSVADGPVAVTGSGLGTSLPGAVQRRWIEPLRHEGVRDGVLRLRAPSAFHATYVARAHGDALLAEARRADPALRRVEISA